MKQNLRTFFLCSFLLLTVYISFAQQKSITGTVTSKADGIPIPGVNVIIQGTSNGTQTEYLSIIELKLNQINESTLNQLESYLDQKEQILEIGKYLQYLLGKQCFLFHA